MYVFVVTYNVRAYAGHIGKPVKIVTEEEMKKIKTEQVTGEKQK